MKIVKYSAVWCGPCKKYEPIFEGVIKDLGLSDDQVSRLDFDEIDDPTILSVPVTRIYDGNEIVAEKMGPLSKVGLKKMIAEAGLVSA